ncbi:MAG TPA: hypothetical protein PLP33_14820 [Leptospiraceae bacterium]|nr:hypothetical protein [Leptospiraceae bacterium]
MNTKTSKYPCIESTEDFVAGNYLVRLWVGESSVSQFYNNDRIIDFVRQNQHLSKSELAELVATHFDKINAIQIKDNSERSSGIMIYTVDF